MSTSTDSDNLDQDNIDRGSDNDSDQEKNIDYDVEFESDDGDPFVNEIADEPAMTYENKSKTFQWTSIPSNRSAKNVQYDSSTKGFQVDLSTIRTPKAAFLEYMDTFLLENICRFTNAEAIYANNSTFKSITPTSLLAWLAILINAGRTKSRGINVEELWSTDPVYGTLFYRAVMSRNQYQSIFRFRSFSHKQVGRL